MSDEELISKYAGYEQMINIIGNYGTKDLINRDTIASILVGRGYEPVKYTEWKKMEEEIE